MPILNKTKRTSAIYNRGREVVKVYDHGKLAWQKQTSIPDYLCFTALEAGQFTLTIPAAVTPSYLSYIEWSKDGRTWTHTDNTSEAVTIDVQVVSGDKVYWRGSGLRLAVGYADDRHSNFSSTCKFDLSGDIRSILYLNDFSVTTTTQQYCFTGLFLGSSVIDASNLRLALAGHSAYMKCFQGCTQLLHAPALMEGNTIMQWQFHSTYQDCTNLITGTDLQATSVGVRGCYYTYRNCISLVKAPNISSITTIGNSGLCAMFFGCTSLTYIKCLATSLYDDGDASHFATSNWVIGVSSTGTFIQAEGVTWPRGASGIPTGWVDVEKRTMPSGYKQVEYLQGMGASRINLGIQFQKNIRILQDITYLSQNTFSWGMNAQKYEVIWGPGKGVDNFYFGLGRSNDGRKWTPNTYYEYDYDFTEGAMVAKINNEIYRQTTGSQPTQNTIYLFCYNNNETDLRNLYMRSQYFKLYMNGVLTKDLVASVRESDGMAGFYDFVNDTLLTSDTDTPFTAGEEI